MPIYTTEDLLQYLYKETSKNQAAAIEKALQSDWALGEKLIVLKDSLQRLDQMLESPRPQSVMAILNYAQSSAEVVQP
jgi:hypothetical protein